MKKIGITGGVGSGKSRVLAYLESKPGIAVFQADLLAHELQLPGEACYNKIVEHFGKEILKETGEIDRKKLSSVVFGKEAELQILNGIVHPEVNRKIMDLIRLEEEKGTKIFVLEAALLTEEIYREMLDEIWYVFVEEQVRRRRLKESRDYTDEKITNIMHSQASEEVFRQKCDVVIDNTGDFESTIEQIETLLKREEIGAKQ